jgi:hypothetical protein
LNAQLAQSIDATLLHSERVTDCFISIAVIPPGDNLMGDDLQLQLADGRVVTGWYTRRFLGGERTYWTWVPGEMLPTCISPTGWRRDA